MKNAFTLVEMLAVIAILMILAAIFFPRINRPRGNHNPNYCQTNLKNIAFAIYQYMQDNNDNLPLVTSKRGGWMDVIQPYAKSIQLYQCPLDASGKVQGTTDYYYNARLAGAPIASLSDPRFTIMNGEGLGNSTSNYSLKTLPPAWLTDSNSPAWRHLEGANYSFADGHVKWMKPDKITTGLPTPTFALK